MIWLALLAVQSLPMTPLPAAMEPAIDRYSRCIFGRVAGPSSAPKALRRCRQVRRSAVAQAEAALAGASDFPSVEARRDFVRKRFAGLDALLLEAANGRLDPDDWE